MTNKILSKLGINSSDDIMLALLGVVLFTPIFLVFIAGLTSGQSSNITMIVYVLTLVFVVIAGWRRIKLKNVLIVFVFYFICYLNIVFFPDSIQYFEMSQYLILLFHIPLGFLFFKTIKSWANFTNILFVFTPLAILIGVYILFFTEVITIDRSETYVTYMEFSYALLPFVCASYACYKQNRRIMGLLLYLFGLTEMLAFGCRGALMCALAFAILISVTFSKGRKWALVLLSIVIIAIVLNLDSIVGFLSKISFFENSYILQKAIDGDVLQHEGRKVIFLNCKKRLSNMGVEISGLFGDRPYCGSVYPHNVIYEILMQGGWFLGSALIIFFASIFIKGLVHTPTSRFLTIFFICAVLGRFFVSDSYLNNGLFWIMIACLLSIIHSREEGFS